MSDDLDKMANALKNMTPSDMSRKEGLNAAMAAFEAEFAADKRAETSASGEKISDTAQGLVREPRPTGQNIRRVRVKTFGTTAMSKLTPLFNLTPRAAMMGGSSLAALIAAVVVFQTNPIQDYPRPEDPAPIATAKIKPDLPRPVTEKSDEKIAESEEQKKGEKKEAITPIAPVRVDPKPSQERPENRVASSDEDVNVADKETSVTDQATPPKIITREKRVVKTPGRVVERKIPSVTKMETRRIEQADGAFQTVQDPVVVQEPEAELVTIPPTYETIQETVEIAADGSTRILKSETIRPTPPTQQRVENELIQMRSAPNENVAALSASAPPPQKVIMSSPQADSFTTPSAGRDQFETLDSNPITAVTDTPVSTFSIDVDTASYSFLRASINRGQLPPPNSIRLEEMINYFPYDYDAPTSAREPFKANVTVTPTPWNADTKLMHIGIKGYVPPMEDRPQSNLVFLIDTSGSMNQQNKLPLLINSFKLLLNTLNEDDTVSIVTYAGRAGTVLEPTPASDKTAIKNALNNLRAGGSTAGAAGLALAYQKAEESFKEDGVNRVILATDGDFNVGFSSPEEMKTVIKKKRETGVFLSVLGFGNGNYNDELMQSLAQNGNGNAAYIDTLSEANKVLANEAGSSLITIAKDVKIQVEFNPDTISEYRLIGYETRALKREDFNNDKVDAGDIGAGHNVTAIYELTPVGSPAQSFDPLRYAKDEGASESTGSEEYAFVRIRHKLPDADESTLQTFPIGPQQERDLSRATDDMRFATAVAAVGQKLRNQTQLADFSYNDAIELAVKAKGEDKHGYRAEFIQLVRLIETLE